MDSQGTPCLVSKSEHKQVVLEVLLDFPLLCGLDAREKSTLKRPRRMQSAISVTHIIDVGCCSPALAKFHRSLFLHRPVSQSLAVLLRIIFIYTTFLRMSPVMNTAQIGHEGHWVCHPTAR